MMTNKLKIDGTVDAYTTYQVYATEGVYKALAEMPPLKSIYSNDWQEYDGIEINSAYLCKLDSRKLTIPFACVGGMSKHDAFMTYLYSAFHTYNFVDISRALRLRIIGEKDLEYNEGIITFKIEFSEDTPLNGYSYVQPTSSLSVNNNYKLDSIPFSQYGVRALEGNISELLRQAEVKENLTRDVSTVNGVLSNPIPVTLKSRDFKLSLLMTSDTARGFWRNWDALLYNLKQPSNRVVLYEPVGSVDCIYKSCSVSEFLEQDGKVWCEFKLTFTTVNTFKPKYVTSDGLAYLTSDGKYYLLNT